MSHIVKHNSVQCIVNYNEYKTMMFCNQSYAIMEYNLLSDNIFNVKNNSIHCMELGNSIIHCLLTLFFN